MPGAAPIFPPEEKAWEPANRNFLLSSISGRCGFRSRRTAISRAPRPLVAAKDMHFTTHDGRQVIDGISRLWAVGAGHYRQSIKDAIEKQAETLDYAMASRCIDRGVHRQTIGWCDRAEGMNHVLF